MGSLAPCRLPATKSRNPAALSVPLSDQGLDRGAQPRRGGLAIVDVAHVAVRIDDHDGRQRAHLKARLQRAAVDVNRKRQAVGGDKAPDGGDIVGLDVDGDQRQSTICILSIDLRQVRYRGDARRTPARPDVDENHPPGKTGVIEPGA